MTYECIAYEYQDVVWFPRHILLSFYSFVFWGDFSEKKFMVKYWSTIEIFSKNQNCGKKNQNFLQKSKFSPKIKIFSKNQNFLQKSKFFPNF